MIDRRQFLKGGGATLWGLGLSGLHIGTPHHETEPHALSRKEHFKPFNRGFAEWQYVEFQYDNEQGQRVGVTFSISETADRTGLKKKQLLIMRHNLVTKESVGNPYDGTYTFDEATSTYTFTDNNGNQLARFSYNEAEDDYTLKVNTTEFNSDEIDPEGLVLNPQGNLMAVSKDGNFTVAKWNNGGIVTNYFADHVKVTKQNGDVVGFGRRDSENLELSGFPPSQPVDIDHTWVHASCDLENGKQAFITAWRSKTGGNFKFADISVVSAEGTPEAFLEYNEDYSLFNLQITTNLAEQENPPDQTGKPEYKMAHGGKVIATLGGNTIFELDIDGDPGQIIKGKGGFQMIEAHAQVTSGAILGIPIVASHSALFETTEEGYQFSLPIISKS